MEQPKYVCDMMVEYAQKRIQREAAISGNVQKQLETALGQVQNPTSNAITTNRP